MSAEKTTIAYNDSTITTLEAGQTVTIKTAETKLEHDIIVTAGEQKTLKKFDGTVVIE